MSEPWSYEVFPHSFNPWQAVGARAELKPGERLMSHHQEGKRTYFTIEGRSGSRPFSFDKYFNSSL